LLPLMEPQWLILSGALLLLVVIGLVIRAHRIFPSNIAAIKAPGENRPGYFAPLSNPYARTLLFIAMIGALPAC
jgi:hypothetical protein